MTDSSQKNVIATDQAPQAIGTYSQAVRTGNTVYLSGQIPLLPETMEIISEDVAEQIHQVFRNLSAVAEAAGGTLDDVVKLNVPGDDPKRRAEQPAPYDSLELSYEERVQKVVKTAGKTKVLFSGGSKLGDEDLLHRAKACLDAGAAGLIFGRNLWQRPMDDALEITRKLKDLMVSN